MTPCPPPHLPAMIALETLNERERRLHILVLLMAAGFVILIVSLWRTQIVRGADFRKSQELQSIRPQHLSSARGRIFDRNGIVLADNLPQYRIEFFLKEMVSSIQSKNIPYKKNPAGFRVEDISVIVSNKMPTLIAKLNLPGDPINYRSLERHFRQQPYQPFVFMDNLSPEMKARFFENSPIIAGADIAVTAMRTYPMGRLAAHVLGHVGKVEEQAEGETDPYSFEPSYIGKQGVEKAMDSYLLGEEGSRVVRVNQRGFIEGEVAHKPPLPGGSVYLTLDTRIQQIVEHTLKPVERGAAVIVDVHSGNIIAMASKPTFDPNSYVPALSQQEFDRLHNDPDAPLINRAISTYAPGSSFKPVVALAALESKAITPNATLPCDGGIGIGNHYFKCWKFPEGHGHVVMRTAIAVSCNGYFYRLGLRTGGENIEAMGQILGLGHPTGIPLVGENPGVMPGPTWLKKKSPRDRWTKGYTANTSIGQGFVEVSPLQMALVTATIANGGTLFAPRLIDRVLDCHGQPVENAAPPPQGTPTGISMESLNVVREGMLEVVKNGTGQAAAQPELLVAGKTGSAQFKRRLRSGQVVQDTRAWFISFAPYENPKYAMCLLVEGGVSGGATCAPLAGAIWKQIFLVPEPTPETPARPLTTEELERQLQNAQEPALAEPEPVEGQPEGEEEHDFNRPQNPDVPEFIRGARGLRIPSRARRNADDADDDEHSPTDAD